jgi:head-tail adaptor
MTLSSSDLTALRAEQAALMPDTCTVSRLTATADGLGGTTRTWATSSTLACRLASNGAPMEYMQSAALQGRTVWMVTLPYGSDVTRADRLTISGHVLEILGFASGGAWETAKRAVCVEVL